MMEVKQKVNNIVCKDNIHALVFNLKVALEFALLFHYIFESGNLLMKSQLPWTTLMEVRQAICGIGSSDHQDLHTGSEKVSCPRTQ